MWITGTKSNAGWIRFCQSFGKPHFDEALTRHANAIRGHIEPVNHPSRKIDVYLCGSKIEPFFAGLKDASGIEVEEREDILAGIELRVELRGCDPGAARRAFSGF